MVHQIIRQYDFNLVYANKLVEDLSEEMMTVTPHKRFENHPAFTLGHLVTGSAMMFEDLGGSIELPQGWAELFLRKGPGDPRQPDEDRSKYPPKNSLLNELKNQHEKVKTILLSTDEKKLLEPVKWRFSTHMPSLLDLTFFMCVNHEAMHLGQLAAWRRAMNLPSALAAI